MVKVVKMEYRVYIAFALVVSVLGFSIITYTHKAMAEELAQLRSEKAAKKINEAHERFAERLAVYKVYKEIAELDASTESVELAKSAPANSATRALVSAHSGAASTDSTKSNTLPHQSTSLATNKATIERQTPSPQKTSYNRSSVATKPAPAATTKSINQSELAAQIAAAKAAQAKTKTVTKSAAPITTKASHKSRAS